jgi:hypothetical protein
MKWKKQGRVYSPDGTLWWAQTHAYVPTAELVADRCIRVYFASLDKDLYGRIGYVDLDIHDPGKILHLSSEPALDLGPRGTFDDSGVSPSCLITINGRKHLYYIGWQRAERVPYMLFCGLAQSDDNGEFERHGATPILDRTSEEPYIRSATTILPEGDGYRMWYVSANEWIEVDGKPTPKYVVRHASSRDGIDWQVSPGVCIDFESPSEYGFGRPWTIRDGDTYKMWYSIRSTTHSYRLGYAESTDGLQWIRKDDEVGIHASPSGWDSEMICFPCVIDVAGQRYLFYNGNQHGKTGFGYAILEHD